MSNHTSFTLPKDSLAWQQAVDAIAELLPDKTDLRDFEALQSLPVFALIVVLPAHLPALDVHDYVQSWVDDQPNWHLVTVAEDKEASYVQFSVENPAVAAVHVEVMPNSEAPITEDHSQHSTLKNSKNSVITSNVYRYLLVPVTKTLMHPAKKTAAAHIIDEQLTSSLRQALSQHYQQAKNDPLEALNLVDCHILSIGHMLRSHKLVCFDMDSTLIEEEVIVELAKEAGVGQEVAEITESAMRGEIDFDESFAQRLALLKGIPVTVLDDICAGLTPSTGAKATISAFKALGYHTVLVSGGFTYFARYIADMLGIDEVHANRLDIEDGFVTGEVQLPIINGTKKAAIATQTAARLGIDMSQVVCVGDGANDLPMMAAADLGVAYRAKPIVQARADAAVNVTGLEGVLYALGYPALRQDD